MPFVFAIVMLAIAMVMARMGIAARFVLCFFGAIVARSGGLIFLTGVGDVIFF